MADEVAKEKFDPELLKFMVDVFGKLVIVFGGLGLMYLAFEAFIGWM